MDVAVIAIGVVSAAAVVGGAMMSASNAVTTLGRGVSNFAGPDSQ